MAGRRKFVLDAYAAGNGLAGIASPSENKLLAASRGLRGEAPNLHGSLQRAGLPRIRPNARKTAHAP